MNRAKKLHKINIDIINNFCHRYQLPIPPEIHLLSLTKNLRNQHLPVKKNLLSRQHPLQKFLHYIRDNKIIITAADKTPHLCLLNENTYLMLANQHLQDKTTYAKITSNRARAIRRFMGKQIATLYAKLKKPHPLTTTARDRTFHILPKLNKHIATWPNFPTCPKTRPVVNDSSSITTKACRLILPYLQEIEKQLPHTCQSAIHVLHKIHTFTQQYNIHKYVITTADINNMYTNIQTHTLINILKHTQHNFKHRAPIINFLKYSMKYTTFIFNKSYYLQERGLPMGSPLSSVLANIYMSAFETAIMQQYNNCTNPPLLLRYIDDILLLTPSMDMATNILTSLSNNTGLEMSHSPSMNQAIFLDLKLIVYGNTILNTTYYKFASPVHRSFLSNLRKEKSTILSQILRVWRQNNNNHLLTQQLCQIISFLHFQQCPKPIIQEIHRFLHPIQTHKQPPQYNANHLLCSLCTQTCKFMNIQVLKFTVIHNTLIASRLPLHCLSACSAILCTTKINNLLFLSPLNSIHDTIHSYYPILSYITPIGNITQYQTNNLLHTIQHLLPSHTIKPCNYNMPAYIHPILHNASSTYGLPTAEKSLKKISNYTRL
jgi:hypothetical protein